MPSIFSGILVLLVAARRNSAEEEGGRGRCGLGAVCSDNRTGSCAFVFYNTVREFKHSGADLRPVLPTCRTARYSKNHPTCFLDQGYDKLADDDEVFVTCICRQWCIGRQLERWLRQAVERTADVGDQMSSLNGHLSAVLAVSISSFVLAVATIAIVVVLLVLQGRQNGNETVTSSEGMARFDAYVAYLTKERQMQASRAQQSSPTSVSRATSRGSKLKIQLPSV